MRNLNHKRSSDLKIDIILVFTLFTIFYIASSTDFTGSPAYRPEYEPEYSQIIWRNIRLDGKTIGLYVPAIDNCDDIYNKYPQVISNLQARGATIENITNSDLPVDAGLLTNFDIVWFDEADDGNKVSSTELNAIDTWVQGGGAVLCLGDESSSPADDVSSALGPYWTAFYSDTGVISGSNIKSHETTQDVTGIYTSGHTWMPTGDNYGTLVIEYSNDDMGVAYEDGSGNGFFLTDDDIFLNYLSNDNAIFINNIFGWLAYRNTNSPSLTGESVSPSTGFQNTTFNFTVTYSDADNNEPIHVELHLNDSSVHEMIKATPSDYDYTDGSTYYYTRTLQPGDYEFYIICDDGTYTDIS
ncbi:MAG: hypothetical protein ACTSUE_03885, partial [Promethearchaeota archaeon]